MIYWEKCYNESTLLKETSFQDFLEWGLKLCHLYTLAHGWSQFTHIGFSKNLSKEWGHLEIAWFILPLNTFLGSHLDSCPAFFCDVEPENNRLQFCQRIHWPCGTRELSWLKRKRLPEVLQKKFSTYLNNLLRYI